VLPGNPDTLIAYFEDDALVSGVEPCRDPDTAVRVRQCLQRVGEEVHHYLLDMLGIAR
jgi:hypothetical protein